MQTLSVPQASAFLLLACLLSSPAIAGQIEAKVLHKEEVWDRRSNPLMGRPDILQEIMLKVEDRHTPKRRLRLSLKGHAFLLQGRQLNPGSLASFHYSGEAEPYLVTKLKLKQAAPPKPTPKSRYTPAPVVSPHHSFPDHLKAKDLKSSPALQRQAARAIAQRHGMENAKVIFLRSFQGPRPPKGGYLYWGVTGKIRGLDHVWQPGKRDKLRPGNRLQDPKRHQK